MKSVISAKLAANVLLVILGALAVLHVLMLLGVLPPGLVWGRSAAGSPENLKVLEAVSLIVTAVFALVVGAKIGYLRAPLPRRVVGVATWVVFGYFVLNIVGNLSSKSALETAIFTPISVVLAVAALRLAIE